MPRYRSTPTATLRLVIASLVLSSCVAACGGEGPTGADRLRLVAEEDTARVGGMLRLSLLGGTLPDALVAQGALPLGGTVAGALVDVAALDDSTVVLTVPDVSPGTASVTVTVEGKVARGEITVLAALPIADAAASLEGAVDSFLVMLPAARPDSVSDAEWGAITARLDSIESDVRAKIADATPAQRTAAARWLASQGLLLGPPGAAATSPGGPAALFGLNTPCGVAGTRAVRHSILAVVSVAGFAAAVYAPADPISKAIAIGVTALAAVGTVPTARASWYHVVDVCDTEQSVSLEEDAEPTLRQSATAAPEASVVAAGEFTAGVGVSRYIVGEFRRLTAQDVASDPQLQEGSALIDRMYSLLESVPSVVRDKIPALPMRLSTLAARPNVSRVLAPSAVRIEGVSPASVQVVATVVDNALLLTATSTAVLISDLPFSFDVVSVTSPTVRQRHNALLRPSTYPVALVIVAPDSAAMTVGQNYQLSATLRDFYGRDLEGRTITWSSSNGARASVNASGLVSAFDTGTVTITATSEGVSDFARISIGARPPAAVKFVASGGYRNCAIANDDRAYCWGSGWYGGLGIGSETSTTVPSVPVGNGMLFSRIATSQNHSCGITTTGDAYCWGSNSYRQLGTGNATSSTWPVAVAGGLKFREIVTGDLHTCALTSDGQAYCWGYANYAGQTVSYDHHPLPLAVVTSQRFTSLVAGQFHTCGLTAAGTAFCWGSNGFGELGAGDNSSSIFTPRQVQGGPWKVIAPGSDMTCGITSTDVTMCWGANFYGQLGGGSVGGTSYAPVTVVGGHTFVFVTAEGGEVCATKANGTAYCWGRSVAVINGTQQPSGTPTLVNGSVSMRFIDVARDRACALNAESQLYCWVPPTVGPPLPVYLP